MTGKQIEKYIKEELDSEPKHDCEALANAIDDVANEIEYFCEVPNYRLMQLLLENRPIDMLHTHSYGFHTANGREIINAIQNKYYEYESAN